MKQTKTKRKTLVKILLTLSLAALALCVIWRAEETARPRDFSAFKSFRDIPGVTAEEIAAIEALQAKGQPFSYASLRSTELFERQDGSLGGFTVLLCEWLSELFGIEFKPEIQRLTEMLENQSNGTLDFATLSDNSERRQNYFTAGPIAQRTVIKLRLENGMPLEVVHRERLPRYVFLENAVIIDPVTNALGADNFEKIVAPNEDSVYRALKNGTADAFIAINNMEATFFHLGYDIYAEDFLPPIFFPAVMASKNPELEPVISIMNKAIAGGAYNYLVDIYRQGYKDYKRNKLMSRLTEDEKNYIRENPVIPFATHYMAYPISFFNRNEKKWDGMVFDIMNELHVLTGLEFKHAHENELRNTYETMFFLDDETAYFMPYVIFIESRRDRFLWPNVSYFQDRYALLSKQDRPNLQVNDIPFQRVGMPTGTAFSEMFHLWFPNAVHAVEYPSTDMAFEALERGEVDYVMTTQSRLAALTNYYEFSNYKANFLFNVSFDIAPAFNLNHEHLRSIFDKAIPLIDTERISNQWMTRTYDFRYMAYRQERIIGILSSVFVLIIVVIVLSTLYRNRRLAMAHEMSRKSQERIRVILDAVPLVINFWDKDGKNIFTNNEAKRLFGLPDKDMYLEKFFELSPLYQPDGQLSETKAQAFVRKAFAVGHCRFEWMHNKLDGEPLPCEITLVRTTYNDEHAVVGFTRDLREEKKLKHARLLQAVNSAAVVLLAAESNDDFEGSLRSGLYIIGDCVDANSVEIWQNEMRDNVPCATLEYYWRDNAANKIKSNVITEFSYDMTPDWYNRFERGELIKGTMDELSEADRKFFSLYTAKSTLIIPISVENKFWGLCCIDNLKKEHSFSDDEIDIIRSGILMVTSAINRHKQAAEILEAMHRANEANRTKTNFLATMSHEIRTPMNAILGMSELALRKNNLPEVYEDVKMIRNAGSNLLAIINDILDFSKIESGRMEIECENYRVASLINDVVSIVKVKLSESSVLFNVNVDDTIPDILAGDIVRIRQSLLNLLNNAVKFTTDGVISFTLKGNRITDETIALDMSVADTGRGIKREDMKKLFNEFVQIDSALNKGIEGTGLGLAITKRLVTAMGGEIKVKSEYGKGSEFTITLPQKIRSQKTLELSSLKKFDDNMEDIITFSAPTARVLIVDDMYVNLKVAEGLMLPYKMHVDTCLSGWDAIEIVKKEQYDAIFMDHMMPEIDGVETVKCIRKIGVNYAKHQYLKEVPIIALTANAVSGMKEMFLENGFNDFLSKPIDTIKLNSILKTWIPKEKQASAIRDAKENESGEEIIIDGVDVKLGLSRTGGKADVYMQTLNVFYSESANTIDTIKTALAASDMKTYTTRVHGLKSAAANIGASAVSDLAKELEDAARRGDMEFVNNNTEELIANFKAILQNIEKALSAAKKNNADTDIDATALAQILTKLKTAANDIDTPAINAAVNELRAFENAPEIGNAVSTILRNVLDGDYDEAEKLIDTVVAKIT